MFNEKIQILSQFISEAQKICLIFHVHPDGDAVGSALAMAHFLKQQNKIVDVVSPDGLPDYLLPLDEENLIIQFNQQRKSATKKVIEADLLIFCDLNAFSRTDDLQFSIPNNPHPKVLIDHHINPNEKQFNLIFSYEKSSSTCEIVYDILKVLDPEKKYINKRIAELLFIGMMTDTGSFSYSINSRNVFDAVADLIELGIDVRGLNQFIYSNLPEHRLRLKGFALLERMVVLPEKKTAYIYLTRDDLQKYHFTSGDTEGLVNYPLSIAGIEFSALFSEPDKAGEVRMSFRSKANFDVNDFAKQLFGGGGHKNASGASAELPLEQVVKMFKLSLINIKI